jgi:hypothetical protein
MWIAANRPAAMALLMTAVVFVVIAAALAAEAQTIGGDSKSSIRPSASTPLKPQGLAPPAYHVEGFRSAKFGMSEAEVRKAIASEFKVDDKTISRNINATEQTTILSVTIPNLLTGAGPARVSYIFGHTRRQLIQVNVLWSAPKNDKVVESPLAGPGAALRNYFLGYGFQSEGLIRDVALADGAVLLFQGVDQKNRAVMLMTGEGLVSDAPRRAGTETQWYLRLSYIENPVKPDVFRIKPGTF